MLKTGHPLPRLTEPGLRVLKIFVDEPNGEHCGAELMKTTGLSSGTIYPILLRYEARGLLESEWESGTASLLGRPRRRFYRITPTGHAIALKALSQLVVLPSKPLEVTG